jgi:hypothetical protein
MASGGLCWLVPEKPDCSGLAAIFLCQFLMAVCHADRAMGSKIPLSFQNEVVK